MTSAAGLRARASGVAIWAAASAACAPSRAVPTAAGEGAGPVLRVPRAPVPIALDGDNDDPGWTRSPGPARTGPFASAGGVPARPYSDARLLWGDGYLYVLLYAADDDIRSRDDTFRMRLSRFGIEYAIEVSPTGAVRDAAFDLHGAPIGPAWRSGAHVSREIDGTPDDARDTDEEWSVEMAVPLASLGMSGRAGEGARFALERCDASTQRGRVCSQWGEREGGRFVIE